MNLPGLPLSTEAKERLDQGLLSCRILVHSGAVIHSSAGVVHSLLLAESKIPGGNKDSCSQEKAETAQHIKGSL